MTTFKSTLLAAATLLLTLGVSDPGYAQADSYDQEFDVDSGGTLMLRSDSGPISVRTWNQERVRVRIRNAEDFEVSLEQRGDDVVVVAEAERRGGIFGFRTSNIQFDVEVPEVYNVDLDTGGGSISVDDITGDVTADTSGGSIEIGNVTGEVVADTSGGRINIGDVVDEDALFEALDAGHLTAAGLDVFMGEPALDKRFFGYENIVLAPHLGSATDATRDAMGYRAIDNLEAFLRGETPRDLVS